MTDPAVNPSSLASWSTASGITCSAAASSARWITSAASVSCPHTGIARLRRRAFVRDGLVGQGPSATLCFRAHTAWRHKPIPRRAPAIRRICYCIRMRLRASKARPSAMRCCLSLAGSSSSAARCSPDPVPRRSRPPGCERTARRQRPARSTWRSAELPESFLLALTPRSVLDRRPAAVSNVPAQALILLNDPFVHEQRGSGRRTRSPNRGLRPRK